MATISFSTVEELPENGIIELVTPPWSEIFNEDARVMNQLYPIGEDDFFCQFIGGLFGSVDVSGSTNSTFRVVYTGLDQTDSITLKCSPWRNPILPEEHYGYQISVYGEDGTLLDESDPFSLDASGFLP